MVVRANGRSLHFSFREKLDAFGRFLNACFRSLDPRADRAPFPDANLTFAIAYVFSKNRSRNFL